MLSVRKFAWVVGFSAPVLGCGGPGDPSGPIEVVTLAPVPEVTAPASAGPTPRPTEPAPPGALACACGVLDFESDGPPTGRCALLVAPDGSATLSTMQGEPRIRARLVPKEPRRPGERAHYAYAGRFDFGCSEGWCGRRELDVLELEPNDLRVVVERSEDGPPSRVLWVTCRA